MIKADRNTMAAAPRWRSGEVGPHDHVWITVGTDDQGETYRQCSVCDARSCVRAPRDKAQRQDWLDYKIEWDAVSATVAAPEVAEEEDVEFDEPVKRGPGRPRKYP